MIYEDKKIEVPKEAFCQAWGHSWRDATDGEEYMAINYFNYSPSEMKLEVCVVCKKRRRWWYEEQPRKRMEVIEP